MINGTTSTVFWSLFGILMAYDLVMVLRYGLERTVTFMWWQLNRSHPILAFVFGGVCFHLFQASDPTMLIGIATSLAATFGYYLYKEGFYGAIKRINANPLAVFLAGGIAGAVFWSEKDYGGPK